ncbi:hypothetical protein AB0A60_34900 [Streptomyces sp. NPDC046275]|uniref:hypothetical protein n=1 Tax=Streptomyces sp. NPDC046275 TaxID=3157201 RepID=UPI0033CCE227
MVVHQPEPLWCCPLGMVMGTAYERARARYDAADQAGRDQDVQAAYAAMLVALVNWCEHQIDAHDTDPGPVEQCPICARFEEAAPGQAGSAESLMTAEEWAYERRVHQVAHRLGPRIVTLVGTVATDPPGPAAQPKVSELPTAP